MLPRDDGGGARWHRRMRPALGDTVVRPNLASVVGRAPLTQHVRSVNPSLENATVPR